MAEEAHEAINTQRSSTRMASQKKKDTHFLALPLLTPISIPQLKESIAYFRSITTAPSRLHAKTGNNGSSPNQTSRFSTSEAHDALPPDQDPLRNTTVPTSLSWPEEQLRVIPQSAHQALGKYHLTLGVMDLSHPADMVRAKQLLARLDLSAMLSAAEHEDAVIEVEKQARLAKRKQPTTMETTIEESRARLDQNLSLPLPPPRPLTVTLAGLGTFPSTKSARVFWASPREQMDGTTNLPGHSTQMRLHRFCLLIRQAFRAEGLITETRPLVLHATVANIRQTTQPKGGRTSKGRAWASSKQRWEGVDGRDVVRVFDRCRGDVLKAEEAAALANEVDEEAESKVEEDKDAFIWARNIDIDRVVICKLGADKIDDPVLEGEWYPPHAEHLIFDQGEVDRSHESG